MNRPAKHSRLPLLFGRNSNRLEMSELKRGLFPNRYRDRSPNGNSTDQDPNGNGRRPKKVRKKKRKRKRRVTLAVLPTLLTLGNAVCGLAAIAVMMDIDTNVAGDQQQRLFIAGILIFAGMLFDALDGSAARMTGQESKFGAELDSLCDAITFGTAPAVMVWRISAGDVLPRRLTWSIGVLFTLCVLIRLARFNVETDEDDTHEGFEGLPSPAAAGTLAAFAIAMPELRHLAQNAPFEWVKGIANVTLETAPLFLPALALMLAYLMVSRVQYPHVFQQLMRGRKAPHQIGRALFVIVGVMVLHELALPVALCYFAFAYPAKTLVQRLGSAGRARALAVEAAGTQETTETLDDNGGAPDPAEVGPANVDESQ